MSNTTTFDFTTLPSTKLATDSQIKFRAGNLAIALLFSKLGLKPKTNVRENFPATNGRFFIQMMMSIKTATEEKPLTHGQIQEMDKNPAKFSKIFHAAFKELRLSPSGLEKLLTQDKVPAAKIAKAVKAYCELTGKEATTVAVREKVADDSVKVETKPTKSKEKPLTAGEIQRQIDKLFLALEQLD
tara:strand:+ start:218 stop:775 length:558 start_codon:yes stop_codon:yes gene_type:complete